MGNIADWLSTSFFKMPKEVLEAPTIEYPGMPTPTVVGTSAAVIGGTMAEQTTLQTMRASGGLTIPTTFRNYLPLIMIFVLVLVIFFKK